MPFTYDNHQAEKERFLRTRKNRKDIIKRILKLELPISLVCVLCVCRLYFVLLCVVVYVIVSVCVCVCDDTCTA